MKKRRILEKMKFKKTQYNEAVQKRRSLPAVFAPSFLPSIDDIPVAKPIGDFK